MTNWYFITFMNIYFLQKIYKSTFMCLRINLLVVCKWSRSNLFISSVTWYWLKASIYCSFTLYQSYLYIKVTKFVWQKRCSLITYIISNLWKYNIMLQLKSTFYRRSFRWFLRILRNSFMSDRYHLEFMIWLALVI